MCAYNNGCSFPFKGSPPTPFVAVGFGFDSFVSSMLLTLVFVKLLAKLQTLQYTVKFAE